VPGHRRDFRVGLKQAFKTIHDPQNILGNVDASEFGPGPFFGSRNRWQNCIRFRIGVTLGARVDAQRHFEPPLVDFQPPAPVFIAKKWDFDALAGEFPLQVLAERLAIHSWIDNFLVLAGKHRKLIGFNDDAIAWDFVVLHNLVLRCESPGVLERDTK
jgi:hypothetical protein